MSSIETAFLAAGLVALSIFFANSLSEQQSQLFASYPFFTSSGF